jgi:hypothetical protein
MKRTITVGPQPSEEDKLCILKNLYFGFEGLSQLRSEGAEDLRDGLSALKTALAIFSVELGS